MEKRKIVEIDEERCNGCGECIPQCQEGALQIIEGKARLVSDRYCDGLGACLGTCPMDAIRIVERDAETFDEQAVKERLAAGTSPGHPPTVTGCPGAAAMEVTPGSAQNSDRVTDRLPGALSQWPIQLHLVPANASYLNGSDLLLAADCVPFAFADFHRVLLAGRKLLIGCPKLDDGNFYRDKLTDILRNNRINSLTVAHMEVPCCHSLLEIARSALEKTGKETELGVNVISIDGNIKN